MNTTDLGWAFLFLVVVGVVIAVGVVVGIIAGGRLDRLMTPRPRPRPNDPATTQPGPSAQEDQP